MNGAEFPIKMVQKFWNNGTSFTDERCAFFILLESAEKGHFQSIDKKVCFVLALFGALYLALFAGL